MAGMRRIIIVGGGASGVLLATHLLRHRPEGLIVVLVEKRADLGAGVAYATRHPDHLLNVRAANMSAFPDDPGHFTRWLAAGARDCGPDGFAPRLLYRDYLADLTDPLFLEGQLRRVRGEAVALREDASGLGVLCRDGGAETAVHGDAVVVATGNEGPSLPPEPWRYAGWGGELERPPIPHDAPVVVIGTGLTMVDRVLWLLHDGHTGPITAVSRHGLMPQAHRPAPPVAPFRSEDVPFGQPVARLTAWLRGEAGVAERAGTGWRAAVDGLRPHTQALWARLPEAERRRFLRHVRPVWDVHRHRIAPEAATQLGEAGRRGQLRILAGRVTGFSPQAGGVAVSVTLRGTEREEVLDAAAVFECRGRAADVSRSENPFLLSLLRDGRARPDALGLGLDVTDGCALIDADGRASDRLYAAGPVTAGTFWEIVAIPDIRAQAASLAAVLAAPPRRSGDAASLSSSRR